jgi:hypothetical protein
MGTLLSLGKSGSKVLFCVWLTAFLGKTTTGFFMIPLLPNVDPAVKREFISLVLCQVSFVPVVLGLIDASLINSMRYTCYAISAVGLVFSVANTVVYILDYREGKSQKVCSGDFLVQQMDKQHEQRTRSRTSTAFHDYVAICFQRGSEKTRMPANQTMIFIAICLVVPFPIISAISIRFEDLHIAYPVYVTEAVNVLTLLVLCTVGNMQVFHGTMSVRGKDTVTRAAVSVAATVVVELVLVFAAYCHVLGAQGFIDYSRCIVWGRDVCQSSSPYIQTS